MRGGPTEVKPKKLEEVWGREGGPFVEGHTGDQDECRELQVFWERETESGISFGNTRLSFSLLLWGKS